MSEKLNIENWAYPPFGGDLIYCSSCNNLDEKYKMGENILLKFELSRMRFIADSTNYIYREVEKINKNKERYNLYA